ncbi:response regulator [Sphingomonas rubra]|uniref:response regulator n=1 Tax=Sphingomonas rubra TaxID=634430 RepID=UPI001FE0D277|nr:response regulator [Sphingomonas rubra]
MLIIEDEPMVAMLIEDTLSDAGALSVAIAATQEDAIDAARHRRPDFITSDVSLLEGHGPAAVQAIFEVCGEIPVLFITATPDDCRPCAPPGMVLAKPFTGQAVAHAFRTMTAAAR